MTTTDEDTTTGPATQPEIVVGIDESLASLAALHWAAGQSQSSGVPLRLVHTWQLSSAGSAAVFAGAGNYVEAAGADARARVTRWILEALGSDAATVRWTLEVHEDPAGPALVARSHGAQMLVVGTREHTGFRRAVSGSVSHYVLSHADLPVVAVPAPRSEKTTVAHDHRATVTGPLL